MTQRSSEVEDRPRHGPDLAVSGVADGIVVYQPSRERIHFLNHTAGIVFELCTGSNTTGEIMEAVTVAFDLPEVPTADIESCFARLRAESLIQ